MNLKFYDASYFAGKYFSKSLILKKKSILKRTILKKKISLKNAILKKKLFLKSRFWKNFCTQKITFWLILARKVRKFCVSHAYLKSTILKKTFFFIKHDFEQKIFCKKHDFEEIFFRVVRFWSKVFLTCQILNQLFKHASDFDLNNIQHVRFYVSFFCSLPSFHIFFKTVRFANVWTYGVGSVSQVILLG